MKINLYKTDEYRTRDGRKALIHQKCDDDFHHTPRYFGSINGVVCYWHITGSTVNGSFKNAPTDIVDVWEQKPVVDWSKYPDYIKFLAMDHNGHWYGYTHKPICEVGYFSVPEDVDYATCFLISNADKPAFSGDWKASLIERQNNSFSSNEVDF